MSRRIRAGRGGEWRAVERPPRQDERATTAPTAAGYNGANRTEELLNKSVSTARNTSSLLYTETTITTSEHSCETSRTPPNEEDAAATAGNEEATGGQMPSCKDTTEGRTNRKTTGEETASAQHDRVNVKNETNDGVILDSLLGWDTECAYEGQRTNNDGRWANNRANKKSSVPTAADLDSFFSWCLAENEQSSAATDASSSQSSSSSLLLSSSSLSAVPPALNETSLTKFVDTHCHLDMVIEEFSASMKEVLAYFPQSLEYIIVNVVFHQSLLWLSHFHHLMTINCEDKRIYYTIGFHPHTAKYYDECAHDTVARYIFEPRCLGVGECGLDYYRNKSSRHDQQICFRRQCKLAVTYVRPLVVHSREAEEDTLKIMREELPKNHKIHMHCFTGSKRFLNELLLEFKNLYVGFTGVITYHVNRYGGENGHARQKQRNNTHTKNTNVLESVRACPLERMLIETDAPYMPPEPYRRSICHPGMAFIVAHKIAKLKHIRFADVVKQIRINTYNIYGI